MSKLILGSVMFVIVCANARANQHCPPGAVADEAIRERVQSALHSNQYFYADHVIVSAEHDNIVLHGFVFSAWDVQDALRISKSAACNRRVFSDLSIMLDRRF
jgi:osmotically-inducible protein OsmY